MIHIYDQLTLKQITFQNMGLIPTTEALRNEELGFWKKKEFCLKTAT